MTREIAFYSAGLRLAGTLWEGRGPGVVICQGFGSTRQVNLPPIGEALAAAGFAALSFDHRGLGESEGARGRIVPAEQVEDIRNALTWLGLQPGVAPDRLALLGVSFGGANAVVAAAGDPRARAVVACVPFGDGERWLRSLRRYWEWDSFQARLAENRRRRVLENRGERVDPGEILVRDPESARTSAELARQFPSRRVEIDLEAAEWIREYRPEEHVARIAPRPLLVLHAAEDRLVPPDEGRSLFARAGQPKEFVLIPDASHYGVYSGAALQLFMQRAVDFLRRSLAEG